MMTATSALRNSNKPRLRNSEETDLIEDSTNRTARIASRPRFWGGGLPAGFHAAARRAMIERLDQRHGIARLAGRRAWLPTLADGGEGPAARRGGGDHLVDARGGDFQGLLADDVLAGPQRSERGLEMRAGRRGDGD